MTQVEFIEVGRGNKTWTATLPEPFNEHDMRKAVRKSGALVSNGIDFTEDEDGNGGMILVGGFRPVGKWRRLD